MFKNYVFTNLLSFTDVCLIIYVCLIVYRNIEYEFILTYDISQISVTLFKSTYTNILTSLKLVNIVGQKETYYINIWNNWSQ